MKKHILILFFLAFLTSLDVSAQYLKPGFDKAEYIEMLKITQKQKEIDQWDIDTLVPPPQKFRFVYRSPTVGLQNRWDLWIGKDPIAVISIRGTISNMTSWLTNLYAAMVPAKGTLHLDKSFTFSYNLADDPKAAVHVGFLVATAYLSKDILSKIDSCYKNLGIKDFIITGHSQGGAITFLLTSYLENLKKEGKIPPDIRFKTYSGASPKVGNLFYAYQYESMTRNWAYSVVNSADWVPETLMSLQTTEDFNHANPFIHIREILGKQKFPKNIALRYAYNSLNAPTKRVQRRYEKYLGKMVSKEVIKQLPEFVPPEYFKSTNYVRVGTPIVLYADEDYYKVFPEDVNEIWKNHMIAPYLYLTKKLSENGTGNIDIAR